jgi:thiamine transport system substrate-binding protein
MWRTLTFLILLALLLLGCRTEPAGPGPGDEDDVIAQLTLVTHDSFSISEEVLTEFEQAHGARVLLVPAGDAGAVLNQVILTKQAPIGDVLFGVDNTLMGRALAEDLFEPYRSPVMEDVPDEFELDEMNRLTPVDYGDVCLNYDIRYFEETGQTPPRSLRELTEPAFRDLVVVENPATSSPGLAFLLATVGVFGEEGDYTFADFWLEMRENGVLVTDGWEEAYFGEFSGASSGRRPVVVSYASSPPAEVVFADPPVNEPPTASVTEPDTCFRQIEFVGILRGTQNLELAQALVDFMLSKRFQEDIPLNMFVFPVNRHAQLPEVFVQWADVPSQPVQLAPAAIDADRERWIQLWTDIVLR